MINIIALQSLSNKVRFFICMNSAEVNSLRSIETEIKALVSSFPANCNKYCVVSSFKIYF